MIDYHMLSQALHEYEQRGYTLLDASWTTSEDAIYATLPDNCVPIYVNPWPSERNCLVGSAEQSLIEMQLPEGRYCAVTPCFRDEHTLNDLTQSYFMKIELFARTTNPYEANRLIRDAEKVMGMFTVKPILREQVYSGIDLLIDGIEVGSYGIRWHKEYGSWVYGTGLALPRFSKVK